MHLGAAATDHAHCSLFVAPVAHKPSSGAPELFVELTTWLPWRTVLRRWQLRASGSRHAPLDPFAQAQQSRAPFIYGFSPCVVPPPADWNLHHTIAGYWFLDDPNERLSSEIADFLANGDPPVAIGFWQQRGGQPNDNAVLTVTALTLAPWRGILISVPEAAWTAASRRDILIVPYVSYHLLFSHVAVVVHHGDAGATAASLRAGLPAVTIPVGIDQFFWVRHVAALGTGPTPLSRRCATPDLMAAAIIVATDKAIWVRAAALGRLIRAEQGVTRAVETISDYLGW